MLSKLGLMGVLAVFTQTAQAENACLTTQNRRICAEYESSNPQLVQSLKQVCTSNPGSSWIADCPGHFGCKVSTGQMTMTTWYQNGETAAIVRAACEEVKGTFVVK
jgi:hypothetical protein